MQRWQRLRLVC